LFVLIQYEFKWIIFSFRYLSLDIARYSAAFDANFMPERYFIWFEILKYTYWISHYFSETFYVSQDLIGQIQFILFSFIRRTVNRYLNLWPALLMFVFCFNGILKYRSIYKHIKYIYGNPRLNWPVCSNSDFLLESQLQEHLDVSWWCGNHCWLGIFPGCTPYYPQPQVAPNFLNLGSKIFKRCLNGVRLLKSYSNLLVNIAIFAFFLPDKVPLVKYNNAFSNYCLLPFLLNASTAGDVQIYNNSK